MTEFSLRKQAVPVFGPALLFGFAEGAILPVLPLSACELGASVPVAAFAVGLVGLGAMAGNVPAMLLATRHGERKALVLAALWCAVAMAMCAWTRHLGFFAVGCFMVGVAQAVFTLARQSYLTAIVPNDFRARAMSIMGGVGRMGLFAGPLVSAVAITQSGLSGAYVMGVITLVVTASFSLFIPDLFPNHGNPTPAVPLATAEHPTIGSTLKDHRRVFLTVGIGAVLVCAVRAARPALIPLWADHLGIEAAVTSLIYGVAAGIELLVFYPAGKLMDKKGRRWVAVPSMMMMGAALLLMPWTTGVASLLAVSLVLGLGNGMGSGLVMTIGADHSPQQGRTHFLGIWHLMADVGNSCGPAVLSLLAATLSLAAGIAITGLVALAAAAQLSYWIPRAAARTLVNR